MEFGGRRSSRRPDRFSTRCIIYKYTISSLPEMINFTRDNSAPRSGPTRLSSSSPLVFLSLFLVPSLPGLSAFHNGINPRAGLANGSLLLVYLQVRADETDEARRDKFEINSA